MKTTTIEFTTAEIQELMDCIVCTDHYYNYNRTAIRNDVMAKICNQLMKLKSEEIADANDKALKDKAAEVRSGGVYIDGVRQ